MRHGRQCTGGLLERSERFVALNVGLDLVGVVLAWWWLGSVLAPAAWAVFLGVFFAVTWFIGGYFYLRWPLMPMGRVLRRLWLAILLASAITLVFMFWGVPQPQGERLSLMPLVRLAVLLGGWSGLQRLWLQAMVRARIAGQAVQPVVDQTFVDEHEAPLPLARALVLMLVAYHPDAAEVDQLQRCLDRLPAQIGYAVVVNDHRPGEPVDRLAHGADCFLVNHDNPGYGRSLNRLFRHLMDRAGAVPPYLGILNTDLSWPDATFSRLLSWLQDHPQVSLAVPQIVDPAGGVQRLCKRNPTLLGLFSRRFLPSWCKPRWLARYDRWYVMADRDYQQVFPATYLSGCCMLVRTDAFQRVGGFDERYFLYLEDADLTRLLSREGDCVHLPVAQVVHGWGRGNYRDVRLMLVNLISAWHYFRKWGWALW
jgi:GT2 family glycosyltransferase